MKRRVINKEELETLLRKHKLWLESKEGGERADLTDANLTRANLRYANLTHADLRYADLTDANLTHANLTHANLTHADLTHANLTHANLRYADLDYSALPLWCGSLKANFDDRQIIQITYHLVKAGLFSKNVSEDIKKELEKLIDLANKFHRVEECGKIERKE